MYDVFVTYVRDHVFKLPERKTGTQLTRNCYCLAGLQCTVKMHEDTTVTCKMKNVQPDFEGVIVEDLQTPLPTPLKKAILRGEDIISINYDMNDLF